MALDSAPTFPLSVWDGDSGNRDSNSGNQSGPDHRDWARAIAEIAATQRVVIENSNIYSNNADEIILIGQPVILNESIQLAKVDNPEVIGLSIVNCNINENCIYITQGKLTLPDWSNVNGVKELEPGKYYYLSVLEKGKLTVVAPDSNVIVGIGRAQNKDTLNVKLEVPIYLA